MNILVLSSPKYHHALRGFAHQFNRYWAGPLRPEVVVASPGPLMREVYLPPNFRYIQHGDQDDYPVERWSDFWLDFLDAMHWKTFVLFLEDFWLTRPVDVASVDKIYAYCETHPDVLRFDLTADRLYAAAPHLIHDYGFLGHLDVIRSQCSDYHISTQTAVWNSDQLRRVLVRGENPWQFELQGTTRACGLDDVLVLGTRQRPVRYAIVLHGGDPTLYHPEGLVPHEALWPQDVQELDRQGYLRPLR